MTEIFVFDGSEKERSFDFTGEVMYIGRSPDNDIQIKDITVSRRHLKITKNEDRYIVKDLGSKNGTYVDGIYIKSDRHIELEKSAPIVIGMSIICLGKESLDSVATLRNYLNLTRTIKGGIVTPVHNRKMSDAKNMALLRKINSIISESYDINEISEKILDHILDHFKRVARAVFILFIEDESGNYSELIISRSRKPGDDPFNRYSRLVVDKVIKNREPIMILDIRETKEVELSDTLKSLKIGSVMCSPLISGPNIRGVLYADSFEKPYGFRKEDLSLLTELTNLAAIAIDDALFYKDFKKSPN
jgi:pSer/pThr/pTyr-binding forkhead associated (FHA) protein